MYDRDNEYSRGPQNAPDFFHDCRNILIHQHVTGHDEIEAGDLEPVPEVASPQRRPLPPLSSKTLTLVRSALKTRRSAMACGWISLGGRDPLEAYATALQDAGLAITSLREPVPRAGDVSGMTPTASMASRTPATL